MMRSLRRQVHDFYYRFCGPAGVHLARTCQSVTAQIDLAEPGRGLRFWLHLTLCQACADYFTFSRRIGQVLRQHPRRPPVDLERVNAELLLKLARPAEDE